MQRATGKAAAERIGSMPERFRGSAQDQIAGLRERAKRVAIGME